MSKKVGKCPNCGYVHGEQVVWTFPNPAKCKECNAELEKAKVVPDKEFGDVM